MSYLSQFRNGASAPLGATVLFQSGAGYYPGNLIVEGNAEYLKSGVLVSYNAAYAQSIARRPELAVSGLIGPGQGIGNANSWRQKIKIGSTYYQFNGTATYYESTDGITWTARSGWTGSYLNSGGNLPPVWDGTRIVGINSSDPNKPVSATSVGGVWTQSATAAGTSIAAIGKLGSLWIAMTFNGIAASGASYYLTSTDGVVWTQRSGINIAGVSGNVVAIISGTNKAYVLTQYGHVMSTSDGISWTYVSTISGMSYQVVAQGQYNGRLVVMYVSTYLYVLTSNDGGVTWTTTSTQKYTSGTASCFAGYVGTNGEVFALQLGNTASACCLLKSNDGGTSWTVNSPQIMPCGGTPSGYAYVDNERWFYVTSTSGAADAISGIWGRTDAVGSAVSAWLNAPSASGGIPVLHSYVRIK